MVLTRLQKEAMDMVRNPPPNCTAGPHGDNMHKWRATVLGPRNTPYEGGIFELNVEFPTEYPMRPPTVSFATKVYHPNVSDTGHVCLDILQSEWTPALSISKVLLSICALLCEPNPESALRGGIAKQLKDEPAKFNETAREWTGKYASC